MQLEEIITSCNQAIAFQIGETRRPAQAGSRTVTQRLLNHVCDCVDCLFAVMDPTTSLVENGCETFKKLLREDGLLPIDSSTSPLAFAHLGEDMIEEYCFGRLSTLDRACVDSHVELCVDCHERLETQREFMRVMKAVLGGTRAVPAEGQRGDEVGSKRRAGNGIAMAAGA